MSTYDATNHRATLSNLTRGYYNTTASTHSNGDQVYRVTAAGTPTPPSVTLAKGVYIMAGGGFSVCGAASVTAPNGVMIYNTQDPAVTTGFGALGQVDINTSGNVHLGPMSDGVYAGMTIFQDRSQTLVPGGACGGKSNDPSQLDIALQSAAPLPQSGELGSVTGGIYAPHTGADFGGQHERYVEPHDRLQLHLHQRRHGPLHTRHEHRAAPGRWRDARRLTGLR